MQLLRFQTAVFFKKPAERPDLLSGNMPSELLTLFDQIPITNPVPPILQGVPNVPDLPVVTLISSRPGYQGTISKSRADFFITIQLSEITRNFYLKLPNTQKHL